MLHWMENDGGFLECIIFSDEYKFHLSARLSEHNVNVWGSQTPQVHVEHICD
jgi:hypothetical protein